MVRFSDSRLGLPVVIGDTDLILGNLFAKPFHLFEKFLIHLCRVLYL